MSICADPEKALESFRSKYKIRESQKCLQEYEDRPITTRQGLKELRPAPAKGIVPGLPPLCPRSRGRHTYIWVIDDDGLLFAKEEALESLDDSLPHHSNLPFDQKAYIGGELWFETEKQIYVSGASGRYGPLSAEQLACATEIFKVYGYAVTSLGWDYDKGVAKRCLERPPDVQEGTEERG